MFIHLLFISARAATSSRVENNYHPESFFTRFVGCDAFAWLLSPCLSVCLPNKCRFARLMQVECGINSWCKVFSLHNEVFLSCASVFALPFGSLKLFVLWRAAHRRPKRWLLWIFHSFIILQLYVSQLKQQNRNDLVKRCYMRCNMKVEKMISQ